MRDNLLLSMVFIALALASCGQQTTDTAIISTSTSLAASTTSTATTTSTASVTTTTTSTTSTIPRITGTVSGAVSADTCWYGDILVDESVVVDSGATLYVEAGTTVKFKHYRGYKDQNARLTLQVYGGLVAEGTADQPIYFTSDATDPQNGDWSMVRIVTPSNQCRIDYCVFEFGQQGFNLWQTNIPISHSIFRFNNWEGIYFESYCLATMESCQMFRNGYNGLAAEQFNSILMLSCEVSESGTNGIHSDASTVEVRGSHVYSNNANGLSVDDNGTLRVLGVASVDNAGYGVTVGEGTNTLTISNLIATGNVSGTINGAYTEVASSYTAPTSIEIGFTPDHSHDLNYIPGDPVSDQYMYVYPDDETRNIVRKVGTGEGLTWSLAWDGQYLWTCTVDGRLLKLDPDSGSVEARFTAPGSQPWGMTYDGEKLWLVDFAEKRISRINPITGSEEVTFPSPDPVGGCKGMAWDGTHLCVMGWTSPTIYKMTREGTLAGTVTLGHGGSGGLAWDGSHFWVPNGNIYKYTSDGIAVGYIYPASEGTWDLEWDGQYLWACQRTNENWQDAKLFALEVLSLSTDF